MRAWEPFRELEALRREIDRTFNSYLPGTSTNGAQVSFLPGRAARRYPLVNVGEDQDRVYVEALAPGIDPDAINLTVVRNTLTISGEKRAPAVGAPESFHRNERAAGKFVRTVDLPVEVDSDKVSARYRNGLLTVTLPKAEAAKPKQIQVTVN
jgi:HSP20 family protein